MKHSLKEYKRIVVKIGSSIFYRDSDLDPVSSFSYVGNLANLAANNKREIIIVSSGAIALGMSILNLKKRPKELSFLQAAAAIGQNALMDNYTKEFKRLGIKCAQVLLTWDDLADRKRYLNAKNTILKLLSLGIVPIINENDTISTEEIRFGDNDRLSALVANLINADLLIMISDVEGLLDKGGSLVRIVPEVTREIRKLACPSQRQACVGGMITKIGAAEIATKAGIPCVITKFEKGRDIFEIIRDPASAERWTLFLPRGASMAAKERWIAFGTKPKGRIIVDDGAKKALLNKKSLLSVGIVGAGGDFERGDIVSIVDREGAEFARGKTGLSGSEIDKVKGSRFDKEVVHRDNIVIL